MARQSTTPPFVKRCVRAVAKRYDGDVSRAFAICVAQYQDSGHLRKGTMQMTKKGEQYAAEKLATDDHAKKVGEYKRQLKRARLKRKRAKKKSIREGLHQARAALRLVEHFLEDMGDE